jgi:hypothetical protein
MHQTNANLRGGTGQLGQLGQLATRCQATRCIILTLTGREPETCNPEEQS